MATIFKKQALDVIVNKFDSFTKIFPKKLKKNNFYTWRKLHV